MRKLRYGAIGVAGLVAASLAGVGPAVVGGLAETLDQATVRVEEVRRAIAELVKVNLMSWEAGDA